MSTASNARSRLPFIVVVFGAEIRLSACSRVSHWPVRIPYRFGPLTREMAAASSGGMKPLSAASIASLRIAESLWLIVEGESRRASRLAR